MRIYRPLALAGLWIVSMAIVAYAATQSRRSVYSGPEVVLSGENIGFRVDGHQGDAPTGTLVIRIDGKWVEARSSVKLVPVK